MLIEHKDIFFSVADKFNCWIGLREPDFFAEKWIGRPGYVPRMQECQARTADKPFIFFSGLVIDPWLCPEAFLKSSLGDAKRKWTKFTLSERPTNFLPPGFHRLESGPEKGLVKYFGKPIYSNYELMSISKSNDNGEMEKTDPDHQLKLFNSIQPELNTMFNLPLIKQGCEFIINGEIILSEKEQVLFFGPLGKFISSKFSRPQSIDK